MTNKIPQKIRIQLLPRMSATICSALFLFLCQPVLAEVVEEIYAIVNGEIITKSDISTADQELTRMLQEQMQGAKLDEALIQMRQRLLGQLIEDKLILSKCKEKNLNVDSDVELIIQEIKKQNNLKSDEELIKGLQGQGLEYVQWKEQIKSQRLRDRLISDEVGSKIKIDNSEIMDYYRQNQGKFSAPAEISLDCIFLSKENRSPAEIQDKMAAINAELTGQNFVEVAKKYSELAGSEDNVFLGKFKAQELQSELEEAAWKLPVGEQSPWIETANGWYLLKVKEKSAVQVKSFSEVSGQITQELRLQKQQGKMQEYIERLKKEAYIKILKDYA